MALFGSTCAVDDQVSCTFLVVFLLGGRVRFWKKSLANNWGDITFRESMLILFSWQTFILILIFLSTSIVFRHTKTWRFEYKFPLEVLQPPRAALLAFRRSNHWKTPKDWRVFQEGPSALIMFWRQWLGKSHTSYSMNLNLNFFGHFFGDDSLYNYHHHHDLGNNSQAATSCLQDLRYEAVSSLDVRLK